MAEPTRPLPNLAELDTGAFWAGTKDHQLRYQRCASCDHVVFHPRAHCTNCTSTDLAWHTAAGTGTVYTFSVVRQSYHPYFRNHSPYIVAWIDLDEGPRILSNVVGVEDPVNGLQVGARVQVQWEDHDGLSIPLFTPVG